MMQAVATATEIDSDRGSVWRRVACRWLGVGIEAGLLLLACAAPWALGAVDPPYEGLLYAAVAVLLVAWAAQSLVAGRLAWRRCPVALCLAGLFLLAMLQLMPLPGGLLASLSPGTAALRERLLPAQPEVAGGGETAAAGAGPLSLYPHGTRQQALQLLAVLAVFALARAQVPAGPGLRRLAWAALANGALLALFALAQALAVHPGIIYGTPHNGTTFGPFLHRGHYASYIILCVGLGLGLLLGGPSHRKEDNEGDPTLPATWTRLAGWSRPLTAAAVVALLGSLIMYPSPGVILALLVGSGTCLAIQLAGPLRLSRGRLSVLGILAAVLFALTWICWARARPDHGLGADAGEETGAAWARPLRWAGDFPVWGTGFGTLPFVDPRQRGLESMGGPDLGSAVNGYAEALAEGGVVRLGLSLLALGLVLGCAARAYRQHAGRPAGGLALGGLFAIAALAAHSAVDFGLHNPAIALLAALLAALLCGLAEQAAAEERTANAALGPSPGRLGRLASTVWAGLAVLVALVLAVHGWTIHHRERLRDAAVSQRSLPRRIKLLERAAGLAPGDARLQAALAEVRWQILSQQRDKLKHGARLIEAAQAALAFAPAGAPGMASLPTWTPTPFWLHAQETWRAVSSSGEGALSSFREALLGNLAQARQACPLWAGLYLWTAENLDPRAGPAARDPWLDRAKLLATDNPALCYECGLVELEAGQLDRAWTSWRRCLELSERYLARILDRGGAYLAPGEMLGKILPDQPRILVAAASLFLQRQGTPEGQPFLDRARALLSRQPGPPTAHDLYLQGRIEDLSGHPVEALAAYEEALAVAPEQAKWRCDLAELLYSQGCLRRAREQLLLVLGQQPHNLRARSLLTMLKRQSDDSAGEE
jgi:tetratricopeptide (TPR) repeat protein